MTDCCCYLGAVYPAAFTSAKIVLSFTVGELLGRAFFAGRRPVSDVALEPLVCFTDAPHAEDARQKQFRAASRAAVERHRGKRIDVISTVRWPASRPDLGWLADKAEAFWASRPDLGAERVGELVGRELPRAVQRVKRVHVHTTRTGLRVSFLTKDDRGYYEHGFEIDRPGAFRAEASGPLERSVPT